ncbi:MAG: right-handed parallel beta-helix repeat-containing protein, partial [Planctomycetota bacterium]|nr:right-handed parallel beta-helix repeat-containing protein [Planctomycetota bacterium]
VIEGLGPKARILGRVHDAVVLRGGRLSLKNLSLCSSKSKSRKLPGFSDLGGNPAAIRAYRGTLKVVDCRFVGDGIEGLCLTGEKTKATVEGSVFKGLAGVGALSKNGSSLTLKSCQFENLDAAAIFSRNKEGVVEDCDVRSTKNMGILVFNNGTAKLGSIHFDKCKTSAVVASYSGRLEATELTAQNTGGPGIRVKGTKSRLELRLSKIVSSGKSGIEINDGKAVIFDTIITGSSNHGVFLGDACTLKGGRLTISNSGKMGFAVSDGSYAVIEKMTIDRSGKHGIVVANRSSYGYFKSVQILRSKDHGVLVNNRGATGAFVDSKIEMSVGFGVKMNGGKLKSYKLVYENNKLGKSDFKGVNVKAGRPFGPQKRG